MNDWRDVLGVIGGILLLLMAVATEVGWMSYTLGGMILCGIFATVAFWAIFWEEA